MTNRPVNFNDPSGHCPLCLTAVIGGAIGGIVGAVGYTAYVAYTGTQFNSKTFWKATGGSAFAGALIGTGVGIAAGISVAGATTAAVGAGGVAEAACADGDCSNEVIAVSKAAYSVKDALCADNDCTNEVREASNYANKLLLQKSLASEAQVSEVGFSGRLIAVGNNIRDASRLVSTYGGQVADWIKLSSSRFVAMDQVAFETHWYANKVINSIVEIKTKILQ